MAIIPLNIATSIVMIHLLDVSIPTLLNSSLVVSFLTDVSKLVIFSLTDVSKLVIFSLTDVSSLVILSLTLAISFLISFVSSLNS